MAVHRLPRRRILTCECGHGLKDYDWPDYFCKRCGAFNRALYTQEHVDPVRAAAMTDDDIRAEFTSVGQPFGCSSSGVELG